MALDLTTISPPATTPQREPGTAMVRWTVGGLLALGIAGTAFASWKTGLTPARLWQTPPKSLETVEVVNGPFAVMVVETGTVESASNTTIKCQVEALLGLVGGTTTSTTGRSSASSSTSSTTSTAPATSAALTMTASTSKSASANAKAAKAVKKAMDKAGGSGDGGGSSASGGGGGGSASGSAAGSGSAKSGASGSGSASAGGTMTITQIPTIRSFSMNVSPYVSLQTKRAAVSTTRSNGQQSSGGKGGGGGGGGGGGRNGGGSTEKQGSTRIIMIRPEGDSVAAGDVVCEFDASAFVDAVLAQRIKTDSARAAMVQAESILEVNQIALSEYRDGVYPQDLQLIEHYLNTCKTEFDRAIRNRNWSQETLDKGFRAPQQHQADVLSVQRAEIALVVAQLMKDRLIQATGPKLIKALEAKLQANRADSLALESTYQTEAARLKKLEKMVASCTLRAPHAGTVVYSLPPSNGWRPAQPEIMEGAAVREGQPIFELPDPKHMRIRAKINESKVGQIHTGQQVSVRIDALPDRRLLGTVAEVTLIPAPASGPGSDVRIYFANINLNSGDFEGLKPGLNAEITFLVDSRPAITQVPIQAIRWVGTTPLVAVAATADRTTYRWQPVQLGKSNTSFAEVVHGLAAGEHVVSQPDNLPNPVLPTSVETSPTLQANKLPGPVPTEG